MKTLIWERFGLLLVEEELERHVQKGGSKVRVLKCVCDCGNKKKVLINNLKSWSVRSCWCYRRKINTKHWMRYTRIYKIRQDIKSRCTNKNNKDYKYYWGRGITYDSAWDEFECFYKDMGSGYEKNLTIDRIDNSSWYNKENCRWATMKTQNNNSRHNTRITYGWVSDTLKGRSESTWINYSTLRSRVRRWTDEVFNNYKK